MTNKNAFQAKKQASAESRAFDSPKHTPQKRLLANVVNGKRLKKRASNGPTSKAGHDASNRPAPNSTSLPICQVYSPANTRQMSRLSSNAYQIHFLPRLELLSVSVRTSSLSTAT